MSKTYDPHTHQFVTVRDLRDAIFGIVLHCGERVWISATHSEQRTFAILVGDGLTSGFDADGNCVLSVPTDRCKFYTPEDAETLAGLIDADLTLLRYAHG